MPTTRCHLAITIAGFKKTDDEKFRLMLLEPLLRSRKVSIDASEALRHDATTSRADFIKRLMISGKACH